jgi:hypothetical protein
MYFMRPLYVGGRPAGFIFGPEYDNFVTQLHNIAGSSNGRTSLSESENFGSIPSPATKLSLVYIAQDGSFYVIMRKVKNKRKVIQITYKESRALSPEETQRKIDGAFDILFKETLISIQKRKNYS